MNSRCGVQILQPECSCPQYKMVFFVKDTYDHVWRKIPFEPHGSYQPLAQSSCLVFFPAVSSWTRDAWGERRSLWAFPRKPFVDRAAIPCRGEEKEEEELVGGLWGGAQNLIALVSLLVMSGHRKRTDRTFSTQLPASPGTLSSPGLFVSVTRIYTSFTPTQASSCHVTAPKGVLKGKYGTVAVYAGRNSVWYQLIWCFINQFGQNWQTGHLSPI